MSILGILVVLIIAIIALLAFGYRKVAAGSNKQVANGVVMLAVAAMLASWLVSGLSFDAGF